MNRKIFSKIFCPIIVLSVGIFIFSCTKVSQSPQTSKIYTSQLVRVLDDFNADLMESKGRERTYDVEKMSGYILTTKAGFWSIAFKDVKGAWTGSRIGCRAFVIFGPQSAIVGSVLGGLLGGAISSAYGASTSSVKSGTSYYIEDLSPLDVYKVSVALDTSSVSQAATLLEARIDMPQEYKPLFEIGAKHNLILDYVFSGNVDDMIDIEIEIDTNTIEYQVVSSEEFEEVYRQAIESSMSGEYYYMDETFEGVAKQIVNLFTEAYLTYPDNIEDVDYLINGYINVIEEFSELTEDEKQAIYIGLVVAAGSTDYWREL